jgi:hypothetical protein
MALFIVQGNLAFLYQTTKYKLAFHALFAFLEEQANVVFIVSHGMMKLVLSI